MRRLLEGYGRKKRAPVLNLPPGRLLTIVVVSVTILYWGWLGLLLTE
jgi:hypothetical protein